MANFPPDTKIATKLRRFKRDENGAVTVDWVLLTGALVALGMSVMFQVGSGAEEQAQKTNRCMKITRNQLFNDNGKTHQERMARAQRNCGRQ